MQTLQQQRAKFALNRVKEAANQLDTKNKKEYKSYASALPFMIHANGLGQAAAFYRSKGEKDTHFLLYKLLSDWLTGNVNIDGFNKENQPFYGHDDLLEGITNEKMPVYMTAQAEAMVFMNWVKRFADAFMRGDEQHGENP
ncbi:MAG TPA: type III-B CRISPR module-associated protein Cmr5 [Thioploca sp.]|nr:MAG: type III-B CRISPR module-associated protein Cmr5 [Gammaproteobacteria bacterium]HDN26373.1 type III-B CRISPR module-associated protein Cmr5 [Thioploca sp.]